MQEGPTKPDDGAASLNVAPTLKLGQQEEGEPFLVDANLVATGRTCVLGSSGSGKSYAVGVICEELCKNSVPFAIIDTEGEYSGLKEKFNAIWVGEENGCDLRWSALNEEELAVQALDLPPLILDLSEADDPRGRVSRFVTILYREISRTRTPFLLVVEEADRFVPQVGDRLPILNEVARRGRKRGLGLMICSQRPSLIDKNVLSQCANQLIGKLVIQNDLQSVAQFFPGRGLPRELTTLKPGTFYAAGGLSSPPARVQMRLRETKHGGVTPVLGKRVPKTLRSLADVQQHAGSRQPESQDEGVVAMGARTQPGLPALIQSADVPVIVKREKSFIFFGQEETVTSVHLQYRSLIELGVRLRTGMIKKRIETFYIVVDGVKGRIVELSESLSGRDGLERFIGLDSRDLEVLWTFDPAGDSSALDTASRMGESGATVRKIVKSLEDRRLVRSSIVGKVKVFRRLVDPPDVEWIRDPLELQDVVVGDTTIVPQKLKEEEVREVVKGLWEGSDLEDFKPFLYPLYRVELALKRKRRVIWLDGRSGKPVVRI